MKNIVYFTIQGGCLSSIPMQDQNVYKANVTPRQQDRLAELLDDHMKSASSGDYDMNTFDMLMGHIKRIKATRI